jgi:hypothetical protein
METQLCHQIPERPKPLCDAGCHRWRNPHLARTPAEIVVSHVESDCSFQVLRAGQDLLPRRLGEPGAGQQPLSLGERG